ncbi:MAG TPA: methyltransferase domain-containing protein [Egibacteraceae bacterium]|nr:methyltransferase domain-containing protein [Egibacteraceae bacterium]
MEVQHHARIPRALVRREEHLVARCVGKRVLHLGCVDHPMHVERLQTGTWLHGRLTEVASEVVGLDIAEESVAAARELSGLDNMRVGDAEQLPDQAAELGSFDVVVAGEIIEHLNNPGLFLAGVRSVLNPGGLLLLTTVNAFCLRRLLRIPLGIESVHPDHVAYYSHATLRVLFERFGYEVVFAGSHRMDDPRHRTAYLVERVATAISPNLGEGLVYDVRVGSAG